MLRVKSSDKFRKRELMPQMIDTNLYVSAVDGSKATVIDWAGVVMRVIDWAGVVIRLYTDDPTTVQSSFAVRLSAEQARQLAESLVSMAGVIEQGEK